MDYKDEISALIEKRQNEMVSISDKIWDYAETRFQEFKSSKLPSVTVAMGTPGHAWQVVAQGESSGAHKGMLFAAKVMASAAYDFISNPELTTKARNEWFENLDGEVYTSVLPKDAKPEIW